MPRALDPEQLKALVAAIEAGDSQAEADLVETFGRGIALLLGRHARRRAEAEDLYQDTFRLAIQKIRAGTLHRPEQLPGFLSGLARNLAIDHYRKIGRRKTDTAGDALPDVRSPAPSPLDRLEDAENASLVRQVLDEMPSARDREVLMRYYLAEQDRDALARSLGLDAQQLSRILYRARQRYKALYLARFGVAALLLAILLVAYRARRR
ncbi:MAG: sigma-70 family RNA polymerase sigma factor [Acidobacteriota bacterium]